MFRTELNIATSPVKIGLKDSILTIGSCFSDNIGQQLIDNKFNVISNPFGTVYNPVSIFKLLTGSIENNPPSEAGYLENDGLYAHYDFHSSFSTTDKLEVKGKVISAIKQTHDHFNTLEFLIITFGTAFVYERKDTGEVVANCHKVPANEFKKRLLTQKEILEAFEMLYPKISKDVTVILTVSPVRHIKDTIPLNSVSKSTLRISCNTLTEQYPNVHYFPSYEILLDDLRDYRFYASDMIHPSKDAEHYIFNKFAATYFDNDTLKFVEDWTKIKAAILHRPFNPTSAKHQKFIRNTIDKINSLPAYLDFNEELKSLNSGLNPD